MAALLSVFRSILWYHEVTVMLTSERCYECLAKATAGPFQGGFTQKCCWEKKGGSFSRARVVRFKRFR